MTTETAETIAVGLAEIRVSKTLADVLVAYGLGSCVAVCVYDPALRVAGMAHVMLPQSDPRGANGLPGKYADTAIPELIGAVTRIGADERRLVVKIVGGAQMLAGFGLPAPFNIGERNVDAICENLNAGGLQVSAQDTGGGFGRTVHLYVATGRTLIRTVGGATREI